jgi:putative intracellular protease/amidase
MQIAAVLFPHVTALDIVGPYEVLQRLPRAEVVFVGHEVGTVRTENGFLGLSVDAVFEDVTAPDVVVVPGGVGSRALMDDHRVLDWLRAVHPTTTYTTSVCTGSLVLGAAGLLQGLTATTHWSVLNELEPLGATPTSARVVEHLEQRIITAAGVSSGIDMALRLSELLVDDVAARAMQLMVEYDPQPPFDCGSLDKASPEVIERIVEYMELLPENAVRT